MDSEIRQMLGMGEDAETVKEYEAGKRAMDDVIESHMTRSKAFRVGFVIEFCGKYPELMHDVKSYGEKWPREE